MNTYFVLTIFSDACAIELDDSRWLPLVVVIGGRSTRSGSDQDTRVQVYTSEGPQEQLPSLQTARSSHACAHYMDSQDRAVSIACNNTAHLTIVTLHCVVMNNNNNEYPGAGSVGDRW